MVFVRWLFILSGVRCRIIPPFSGSKPMCRSTQGSVCLGLCLHDLRTMPRGKFRVRRGKRLMLTLRKRNLFTGQWCRELRQMPVGNRRDKDGIKSV